MTRHSLDPLRHGAFSSWAMSTEADHALMARPLAHPSPPGAPECPPAVWLSGEHSCPNYCGFVHGGLLAGRRDAFSVLAAIGIAPRSPPQHFDTCDQRGPGRRLQSFFTKNGRQ